jgi:hypothetical protein
MKASVAGASLLLLSFGTLAAHRLDEYLQATMFSLEKDQVRAQIRLTPGVAVFPAVVAIIDSNGDGVISTREQRVYAERVLADLSLTVDGDRLKLRLISANFPEINAMKEGSAAIEMDFAADLRSGSRQRTLEFENRHQRPIATFLVNCLVSQDPDIRITAQHRNYEQSHYQLTYDQDGLHSAAMRPEWWSDGRGWFGLAAAVLFVRGAVLRRRRQA